MDDKAFFAEVRAKLGALNQSQIDGFNVVLEATDGQPLAHRSYSFATAWWETGRTMRPVREGLTVSEAWRKANLRYYPWYGRGYVQLTWERNYLNADLYLAAAGLIEPGALMANLDIAMVPKNAAHILRGGMDDGWFTKVKLADVLPSSGVATAAQYLAARTIINGHDKADVVENFAQIFERAFRIAGYL
jgi:putative chitinase